MMGNYSGNDILFIARARCKNFYGVDKVKYQNNTKKNNRNREKRNIILPAIEFKNIINFQPPRRNIGRRTGDGSPFLRESSPVPIYTEKCKKIYQRS